MGKEEEGQHTGGVLTRGGRGVTSSPCTRR